MDDDEVVNPLGVPTTNYGWTKPTVGADVDVWGGYLNADLDGIDTTVKSVSTVANAAYPASNPAGYQTAANVTASLGAYLPLAGGTMTGAVTLASGGGVGNGTGDAYFNFNTGTGAHYSAFAGQVNYVNRWNINLTGVPSETGSGNFGSDFNIIRCADNGTQLGSALSIQRSSGITTIANLSAPQAIGDNRIINGDMRIDQRWNGASGTAISVYTIDRWGYAATQASKGTWGRNTAWPSLGFPYAIGFVSSSAYALLTSDTFHFNQPIEADMISDFAWGTASAQPVTLSFWVQSSLTGTFAGAIQNYAGTRSYQFTYSISVAGSPTKVVITIPGDTAGTWVMSGSGGGLSLRFSLGTGATYSGPANVWGGTVYNSVPGAVSVVSTNGASLYLSGVKLEVGSVATPYNRQSLAKSMADCQRYFSNSQSMQFSIYSAIGNYNFGQSLTFPVTMRAVPTVTLVNPTYTNASGAAVTTNSLSAVCLYALATAVGISSFTISSVQLSAEL